MSPTRRDLAWTLAALGLSSGVVHAQARVGIIIADQVPAAEAPAASRAAYEAAIAAGADFLGASLVTSSDGTLIALPDNDLGGSTDVALRPQFAARRTTKTIDGASVTGWFAEDFTLEELKSLVLGAGALPTGTRHPGQSPPAILTFQEVIDIARAGSVRTARVVGVWADLRHPAYFAGIDLGLEARTAEIVRANGYNSPAAAMFVSASEPAALKSLATLTRARLVQRLDAGPRSGDALAPDLEAIRAYARAVSLAAERLLPDLEGAVPEPPDFFVSVGHAAGLAVFARLEHPGADNGKQRRRMRDLFVAGCDGIVCGTPADAVRARNDAAGLLRRQERAAG